MTKCIIIILAIFCYSPQVLGFWPLVREIIEHVYTDVVSVRTLAEVERRSNEFAVIDFIGLIEQYEGYTAEEYDVQTSDGYILKLHRLSGSPSSPAADGKPVIYFGLALFAISDTFVATGPQQALLFMLADAGYDVWIGNFRGTTYSKRHVKYSARSTNLNFWDFSMDELGLIDLPLFIDTVLEKTKKKKLTYIGLSMGTTMSAMLLSARPEYNDKMNVVVSIAPVVLFTPPYSSFYNMLLAVGPPIKNLALTVGVYQLLPQSKLFQIFGKDICVTDLGKILCEGSLNVASHVDRVNKTVLPTVLAHYPAGGSIFMSYQYAQFALKEKFERYDYGFLKNWMKYGSFSPPEYDLTKITSPQAVFYGDADVFTNTHDVEALNRTFPNIVAFEKVPGYNHIDFVLVDENKETVYKRILQVIDQYSID